MEARDWSEGAGWKKAGGIRHGYQKEDALQEAWESLRFDRSDLRTTDRQTLRILRQGKQNWDQGPDFLDAEIQIGRHRHHGHVELHLNADDWERHGHHLDPQYNAVVLHVYLNAGKKASLRADGSAIPCLHLGDRIAAPQPVRGRAILACSGVGKLHLPHDTGAWLEEAGVERLAEKSKNLEKNLLRHQYDWSQLFWEELAAALGGPVNADHFRQLSRQLPWGLARKYTFSTTALEALLFGVCGALQGRPLDPYQAGLQEEWQFLQSKHGLSARAIPFKFHRMHPAGFPTVRIAQLAALVQQYRPLFQLLEVGEAKRFLQFDGAGSSDYWAHRYEFGNGCNSRRSEMGADVKERIVVNVLAPIAAIYAGAHLTEVQEMAFAGLLRELPAEENKITRKFGALGLLPRNALQSQGMIGIYRNLCSAHRCLECPIGRQAMGRDPAGTLGSLVFDESIAQERPKIHLVGDFASRADIEEAARHIH